MEVFYTTGLLHKKTTAQIIFYSNSCIISCLLQDPANRQKFQLALFNRFSVLEQDIGTDVDKEEKQISETILDCATSVWLPICNWVQPWISDECLDLADKRKQAKHVNFEEYQQLNSQKNDERRTRGLLEWRFSRTRRSNIQTGIPIFV